MPWGICADPVPSAGSGSVSRGVMTKGGLETIRSKCSPVTGSSRSPWTRRMRSAGSCPSSVSSSPRAGAFRTRLNRVNSSARSDRSVAVTCWACGSRCRVWIPQPEPRSRARSTGRRSTFPARVREARPIPSTCQEGNADRACRAVWSLATQRSPRSSVEYGERSTTGWNIPSRIQPSSSRAAPSALSRGRAASSSSTGTGSPSIQAETTAARPRWAAREPSSGITWDRRSLAGSACSRSRACVATGPSSASTASVVYGSSRRSAARSRRACRSAVRGTRDSRWNGRPLMPRAPGRRCRRGPGWRRRTRRTGR